MDGRTDGLGRWMDGVFAICKVSFFPLLILLLLLLHLADFLFIYSSKSEKSVKKKHLFAKEVS